MVARAARPASRSTASPPASGQRVVDRVDGHAAAAFSLQTLRGRAMAVGERLPVELSRAAMAVRCNGLCAGGSGATVAVADGLAALLNAGVHPCIPRIGSVGASDLCLLAHVGLSLIGEGEAELDGQRDGVGRRAGPGGAGAGTARSQGRAGHLLELGGVGRRDGPGPGRRHRLPGAMQVAAALSMEGFRANLSPLDPRVVAARPAPGQAWAAGGLRALLSGGALTEPGRGAAPPGSAQPALRQPDPWVAARRAGAAGRRRWSPSSAAPPTTRWCSPTTSEILSTGNFHVPALAMALDATAIALAQVAAATSSERQARLKTERLSGLPSGLSPGRAPRSGLSPLSKTAQALTVDIRHLAAPLSIMPTIGADSVEDDSTGATHAALRVREQIERMRLLAAIELIVAAQAVDLALGGHVAVPGRRAPRPRMPRCASGSHRCTRTGRWVPTWSG